MKINFAIAAPPEELTLVEKIKTVDRLMKYLKVDYSLDYVDEEGCGYEIFILDPELASNEEVV